MKSELLNYLENIITLEKTVYIQEKTIDAIDANLRKLGIPAEIEQRRTEKRTTGVLGNACGNGFMIGAALGFLIYLHQ